MELLEQHFDTAFAAPEGINKLRELILALAMQGKLVPQDPSDPPASQLLKDIEAEKSRLWRDGKIKPPKPLPEIKPKEIPYAPPQGWEWVRLGNSMLKITDGTHHSPPNSESGDHLYISAKNIKDDGVLLGNATYVTKEVHDEIYARCNPEYGNLLYIKDGATTGIVTINNLTQPFSMLSSVALLKQPPQVDNRFLLYALRSPFFYSEMRAGMTGVAITRVTLKRLNESLIPLPPLKEQHRIVAKIDQLMARCDELEALRAERERKRRSVHTAALKQLLNAKATGSIADSWQLISQHFSDFYVVKENVAELRKAILQLAVQGRLLVPDGSVKVWGRRRLKDLATKIGSGSTPAGGKESYQDSGVPLIRSMNIHFGGFVHDGLAFLNDAQAEKLKNVSVKADDVLLNITGASIGRVTIAPSEMEGARVNQHVCIIRANDEVIPRFLEAFLASPIVQGMIGQIQVGATREALTKAMIEQFEIPLPFISEQRSIVAKIDQFMTLCDTLELQIDVATSKQTELLDALMAPV